MSDIRFVVLSDMHLGHDQSILTRLMEPAAGPARPRAYPHKRMQVDARAPAPALTHMMDVLAELIGHNQGPEPPVLILLGDIIELALAEPHVSTMVFEQFAGMWQRDGQLLFSKVIFLAGNHDHPLWERARAAAYADYLAHAPRFELHPPALHTTSMTTGLAGGDPLLRALIGRALDRDEPELEVFYPNLALRAASGKRVALLHHGQYAEPLYRMMSTLAGMLFPEQAPLPPEVELWEKENAAWIDFFWSALSSSGVIGADVERVYDALSNERKLRNMSQQLARSLSDAWRPESFLGKAEKVVLDKALPYLTSYLLSRFKHERAQPDPDHVPSKAFLDGLHVYANGPLINQAHDELGPLPDHVSLIFGHTHQPFERIWDGGLLGDAVELYNTGGWAVDPSPALQPHMGGAAVLLDEELNGVSVRFFNQAEDPDDYRVRLATARMHDNPLHARLSQLVDPDRDPYAAFSRAAAAGIARRFEVIRHLDSHVPLATPA